MASILIVEDEKAINELVKRNLQLVGHQCVSVFDGLTAISELDSNSYDLMILDIMLPGLDGFDVIRHSNKTPTIFLTARKAWIRSKVFFRADDYLVKPFEIWN